MLRRLRETGPTVLVPLAWTVVAAAHHGTVAARTLLVAHVVMTVLLVGFVVLSWTDMRSGVLLAWRRVMLAGIPITVAGVAGLLATPRADPLLGVAVVGWMVLPAAALLYTGREARADPATGPGASRLYFAGGALAMLGAVAYVLAVTAGGTPSTPATLAGLALVGVGQTAGIVGAAVLH